MARVERLGPNIPPLVACPAMNQALPESHKTPRQGKRKRDIVCNRRGLFRRGQDR
jgi:hypothetical protein